ncbi:MAG TPA: CtsR family transcriptional regulator, partial [Bacilli bacterium]
RIQKIEIPTEAQLHEYIMQAVRDRIDQLTAEGLIYQLEEAEIISRREANMLRAAISRETLPFKLPLRDEIRARLLKSMIVALLSK